MVVEVLAVEFLGFAAAAGVGVGKFIAFRQFEIRKSALEIASQRNAFNAEGGGSAGLCCL